MKENQVESTPAPAVERISEVNDEMFNFLETNFKDVKWDRVHLENFLSSRDNVLLIAKSGNEGAGILRGHFLQRYDDRPAEVFLNEIDVLPQYQGKRIGTFLVEELKRIGKENGSKEVWVITNKSNTGAMRLYEKTGGVTPLEDDVVFVYDLEG